MKKHLVIICGVYYPNPSPTGLCAKRFAELMLDEYDVEIISLSENGQNETVKNDDGITVYTLSGVRASAEKKASGITKKLLHAMGGIQIKTSILGNLKWYEKKVIKKLHCINKSRKIDTVFSICSPMAAHSAACKYKKENKNVKWCAYTVDPYSSKGRIRPVFCSFEKLALFEKNIISKADMLLLSEEVYKNRLDLYDGKAECEPLPYMLPYESNSIETESVFSKEDINCVYGGRFYPGLRDPEKMLKCFSNIKDHKIKLHLFSIGCEDTVSKYAEFSPNIILHNQVSHKEILKVYEEADILISVGNNSLEFFPSKIFEYIITRKPLVHFYGCGVRDSLLEDYPSVLQIDNNSEECETDALESFIFSDKEDITRARIEQIYYKHTAENIKSILTRSLRL